MIIQRGKEALIKIWSDEIESSAMEQLMNVASLPFIHKHVAVMPDVHAGIGATVGSVIPTYKAIIPAAVGVDIGCGMVAVRTSIVANDLPDSLSAMREAIELRVPVGFSGHAQGKIRNTANSSFVERVNKLDKYFPKKSYGVNPKWMSQMGTLGGGNHFIEVCLDEDDNVWIMLHSGSRGFGNWIGRYFIEKAKEEMETWHIKLQDKDLAYFPESTDNFKAYTEAVLLAQDYAMQNRKEMLILVIDAMKSILPDFEVTEKAVNCHHNYVSLENHFGKNVWLTRKGAIRAREGDLGIIPGSMGAKSFIVEGKGNKESFCSCSHGAGRVMSRRKAKETFSIDDLIKQTSGVECRKDSSVIDEIPGAYKDIDKVMDNQSDLVSIRHTLKQVLCVKG